MARSIDRRSSASNGDARPKEQLKDAEPMPARPTPPGHDDVGPSVGQFFNKQNRGLSLSRADYLNLRSAEEYARREQAWWRRLYRRLTDRLPVRNMPRGMADAHARSLDAIEQAMRERESKAGHP